MTVLMLAMGGAIMIASSAVPDKTSPVQQAPRIGEGLDRLVEELQAATLITEQSTQSVTFLVADRDGDDRPEVIRYAWTGSPGDPLARSVNGGAKEHVLDDLDGFALAYTTSSVVETYAPPTNPVADEQLMSHGGGNWLEIKGPDPTPDIQWAAETIVPTLPEGTTAWTVNRVVIKIRRVDPASDVLLAQLRTVDADGAPTTTVLAEDRINEWEIGNGWSWQELTFDTDPTIPADQPLAVVFGAEYGTVVCELQWSETGAHGRAWLSGDEGDSWVSSNGDLQVYAYGAVLVETQPGLVARDVVERVRVTAMVDGAPRMESDALLLNRPEVLTGYWEADFSDDPTQLDVNGDGIADWETSHGGPVPPDTFANGAMSAHGTITTKPDAYFLEPTIVDVRLRDGAADGASGGVLLNVDTVGTTFAQIVADVHTGGSMYQQLTLSTRTDTDSIEWFTVDLPDAWVDLRLLIDPDADACIAWVNGTDMGSFHYPRKTISGEGPGISLYETAEISGVMYDSIRITSGGRGTPIGTAPDNHIPVAEAALWPSWTSTDTPVTFSAEGSFDPDGDPLTYTWDFGDGNSPTSGSELTYAFGAPGFYTVTLTVSDESGDSDSVETTVLIWDDGSWPWP
jgi:hypothetical protein